MTTKKSIALILAAYALAVLVAFVATALYIAATPGVDRQGAAGMTAFGDALFFLAVLAVAALPPTAGTLYFLRAHRWFWAALSTIAVALTAVAFAAMATSFLNLNPAPRSMSYVWVNSAPLWSLAGPASATLFVLAAVLCPIRRFRIALFSAAAGEVALFSVTALRWLHWHLRP